MTCCASEATCAAESSTRRTPRSSKRNGARFASGSPGRSGSPPPPPPGPPPRPPAPPRARRSRPGRGVPPPAGLPAVFLEPVADALRSLVARWARGRGPFTTAEASAWFGVDVEKQLREFEGEEKLVPGGLGP